MHINVLFDLYRPFRAHCLSPTCSQAFDLGYHISAFQAFSKSCTRREDQISSDVIEEALQMYTKAYTNPRLLKEGSIGPTKTTPQEIVLKDPAEQTHQISTNGIYQIIDEGQGRYRVKLVRDHDHF